MNPVIVIAKRELGSFFNSLAAYIILIAFLGFSGFFTWLFGSDVFMRKEADMMTFFNVAFWTLFFFIPAITMKQLAEEKKSGTLEMLLTKSVTDRQLVMGKWLACFLMVCIALLFTLPYYMTISQLGEMDHGATISGYLGLILMSAVYISIGLFTSSLTNNQIVAFLLALFIGIFFHFLFNIMGTTATGWIGELLETLSVSTHFESIIRGVIDSKDIIYFISLSAFGILLAEYFISNRK